MRKPDFRYFAQEKQKLFCFFTGFFACFIFISPSVMAQGVQAKFSVDENIGCDQLFVQFTDDSEGDPTHWNWDLGNGEHSTDQSPTAVYKNPGTYKVKLTVSNEVSTSTDSTIIKVYISPTVDFVMDSTSGCYPLTVQFTDKSTPGTGKITDLTWDFGDASPFSDKQHPTHTYNKAGTFKVKLVVENTVGCKSSTNKEVVTNEGVIVSFKADKTFSCDAPAEVHFTASTSSTENISYSWDFGDGNSGSGKTTSHTYTQNGKYAVTLTAANNGGGCQNPAIKEDYIYVGTSVSDFEIPQDCANASLTFKNTSSPKPISSIWDFGDGGTSTKINPRYTYNTAGKYTVKLTNDFGGGCTQTIEKEFTIYPPPKADFKTIKQQYCGVPAEVNFENLSTGASSWKWKFGDGDSSAQKQPAHTYQNGGDYDVTLIAISDKGCVDTIQKDDFIQIEAPALLDFKANESYGCIGTESTFSIPNAGDFSSFQWMFGDGGAPSTNKKPTHQYNKEGTYTVTLNAVTKNGCTLSKTKTDFIRIGTKPKVDFTVDLTEVCLDTFATFTNLSKPAGDIWKWEFPMDSKDPDTEENPRHQFHTLGPQDVILVVSNNGCIDSAVKKDYIDVNPPKAAFKRDLVSCNDPLTYHFTDNSVGPVTKRIWDFGDGEPPVQKNEKEFNYTFKKPGAKNIKLTVFNGNCSSTTNDWVQIGKENPDLKVSDNNICHGNKVTLSIGSFQASTYVKSIKWYDGSGDSVTVTDIKKNGNQQQFSYKDNGTYTPAIKITYEYTGCSDSATGSPVTVQGPTAGFTASINTLCQGNKVTFTSDSKTDPAGTTIKQWEWDFDDGATETVSTSEISHLFTKSGNIPVSLKVTDDNGCTDVTSKTQTNEINVNPSSASILALDTTLCPNVGVEWVNNSIGGTGIIYEWDLGNGKKSVDKVPQMAYDKDGDYTVSLKVTTDKGCVDSVTKSNYITVGTPQAVMANPMDKKICRLLKDTAINLSKNYNDILWDFGDGTTTTRDTAYHIYNVPGTYTEKLIVNGFSDGCQASTERKVTIAGPNATPVLTNMEGCSPLSVDFSANNLEKAVKYQWFFGNGDVSSEMMDPKMSYTYTHAGLYHPVLKLTDHTGCYVIVPIRDTLSVIVDSVGVIPEYSWPEVCDSNVVLFDTEGSIFSVDSLGEKAKYIWNFDLKNNMSGVSNKKTPTHRYPASGTYDAHLNVETSYGCKSSIPFEVTIPDSIVLSVAVNVNPTTVCKRDPIQLNATSNIGYHYEWSPSANLNDPDTENPVAFPVANTTYQVIAYSQGDCQTATAEVDVVVHELPQVDAGPDIVFTPGSVVQLNAEGRPDVAQWSWSPIDYLSCTHCSNPLSTPTGNIVYTVTGKDGFGCENSDSIKLSLACDEGSVFLPNAFTPNNDGMNDIFYPKGEGVREVVYFRVYDRWGKLLFERSHFQLNDQSSGWNGTYKNKKLSPGVFVYITSMICDNNKRFQLKGSITLLR